MKSIEQMYGQAGFYVVLGVQLFGMCEVDDNGVCYELKPETLERDGEILRQEWSTRRLRIHGPFFQQKDLTAAGHFFRHTDLGHWHEVPQSSAGNDGVEILYHAPGWPANRARQDQSLALKAKDERLKQMVVRLSQMPADGVSTAAALGSLFEEIMRDSK
jgi:hypothetical protein